MEKTILNYKIVIEKEKKIYNAYCPALGLADWGKTIDQAIHRMTDLIKFHIESLMELGYTVPRERETTISLTTIEIPVRADLKFSYL